jgi:hypothetical protein
MINNIVLNTGEGVNIITLIVGNISFFPSIPFYLEERLHATLG